MATTLMAQAPCVPAGAPIASLKIVEGMGKGQLVAIRRAVVVFGAKRDCKIVLRDPRIERRHCVIVNTGYKLVLRDLGTMGQTLRNGAKVEHEVLSDGDLIKIGPWGFKFRIHEEDLQGASDSPVVVDLEPDPTILAIEDPETKKIVRLTREVSVIGRHPGADFPVQEREASRSHAIVFSYLGRPAVFDLCSENGTFVNDVRVGFKSLSDGDVIRIGSRLLRFRSSTQMASKKVGNNGASTLKPKPFENPEGTLSDLIDISAETRLPKH